MKWIHCGVLVSLLLVFGCPPKNTTNPEVRIHPDSSKEINFTIAHCWDCKTKADIDSFELSLGSQRLSMDFCDLALAFAGDSCEHSLLNEAAIQGRYANMMTFFKEDFGIIDVFIRDANTDTTPRVAVAVVYDTLDWRFDREIGRLRSISNPQTIEVSQIVLKIYFKDSIIEAYQAHNQLKYLPDTNMVWGLYDKIVVDASRQLSQKNASPFELPYLNPYFYTPSASGRKQEFRFPSKSPQDGFGWVGDGAPFKDHYTFYAHADSLKNGEWGDYKTRGTCISLGWAGPSWHYVSVDSSVSPPNLRYRIRPEDFSIYFAVQYFE